MRILQVILYAQSRFTIFFVGIWIFIFLSCLILKGCMEGTKLKCTWNVPQWKSSYWWGTDIIEKYENALPPALFLLQILHQAFCFVQLLPSDKYFQGAPSCMLRCAPEVFTYFHTKTLGSFCRFYNQKEAITYVQASECVCVRIILSRYLFSYNLL